MGELFVILLIATRAFPWLAGVFIDLFAASLILLGFGVGRNAPRICLAISGRIMMGIGLWFIAHVAAVFSDQPGDRAQITWAILTLTVAMCIIRLYQEWEYQKQQREAAASVHAAMRR